MKRAVFALMAAVAACGDGGGSGLEGSEPVVANYSAIVYASYNDTLTKAKDLKTAIDAFVAAPTATTLEAAKTAWKAAREPYGQTESYRFYDGPIDNPEDGPEGRINAWPVDESQIDYVFNETSGMDDYTKGMINDKVAFPDITKEIIAGENEKGAEDHITTGYHAIEFLLWGQDRSDTGPGARPHTDYLMTGGTAMNPGRRGKYLQAVAELLVDDLQLVTDAWKPGAANYAADFKAEDGREDVRRMLFGIGSLSGAELSGERMNVALENRDQEDEHSCFSDNTHRDLRANAIALQNVYLGKYGAIDGAGIDELVRKKKPALDTKMTTQLAASVAAIEAIPMPFDRALQDDTAGGGRAKIMTAITALRDQTDTMVEVATELGITLNLEE
jgi:putative iron-regulated protein